MPVKDRHEISARQAKPTPGPGVNTKTVINIFPFVYWNKYIRP